MRLRRITVSDFKRLSTVALELSNINVVVGGNNSGKSSLLQGIHFAVTAAVTAREQGEATFSTDFLTYAPAADFATLRHGQPYQNSTEQPFSGAEFFAEVDNEPVSYKVALRRGRNYGNISCDRTGDFPRLGNRITDPLRPFSIYVPGLAGIPQHEEFRPKRAVLRGVASGDANLYLRNVLLLLKNSGKLKKLVTWMQRLFPAFVLDIKFDTERDTRITANVFIVGQDRLMPLELAGTGVQQALQIFSYVTLFEPQVLLLDEPDSHLHPTNQYALAEALKIVASESQTTVIASTHSKHIVDALHGEANFVWLKNGSVFQQGMEVPRLPLLMDLGALDSFDKLGNGQIDFVFLTEDSNSQLFRKLLQKAGYPIDRVLLFSYKTSSALNSAYLLVDFIHEVSPQSKVIIHRDRDLMTDDEVAYVRNRIQQQGAIPFITDGSDIESYFCHPGHLQSLLDVPQDQIDNWLAEQINGMQVEIIHSFTTKRSEIRGLLYRAGQIAGEPPGTLELLGNPPFAATKIVGKSLLKRLRGSMHQRFGKTVDLLNSTPFLNTQQLEQIRT